MACQAENSLPSVINQIQLFIAPITETGKSHAFKLLAELRSSGITCDMAYGDRALKGAMKAADKSGSRYVVIIGDDEVASGSVELKRMSDGTITSVKISELQKALIGVI